MVARHGAHLILFALADDNDAVHADAVQDPANQTSRWPPRQKVPIARFNGVCTEESPLVRSQLLKSQTKPRLHKMQARSPATAHQAGADIRGQASSTSLRFVTAILLQ